MFPSIVVSCELSFSLNLWNQKKWKSNNFPSLLLIQTLVSEDCSELKNDSIESSYCQKFGKILAKKVGPFLFYWSNLYMLWHKALKNPWDCLAPTNSGFRNKGNKAEKYNIQMKKASIIIKGTSKYKDLLLLLINRHSLLLYMK